VRRTQDHGSEAREAPEERLRAHVELDQIADLAEGTGAEQGRVFPQKLRVVGARAVDVGTREQHHLLDGEVLDVLEQALQASDVGGVVLSGITARIVSHAQVDERAHAVAEHVLHARALEVELVVLDVGGPIGKGAAIDADDAALAVQLASEAPAQAAAHARDQHGAVTPRRERHRRIRQTKMLRR
jgi:hypothetical protein